MQAHVICKLLPRRNPARDQKVRPLTLGKGGADEFKHLNDRPDTRSCRTVSLLHTRSLLHPRSDSRHRLPQHRHCHSMSCLHRTGTLHRNGSCKRWIRSSSQHTWCPRSLHNSSPLYGNTCCQVLGKCCHSTCCQDHTRSCCSNLCSKHHLDPNRCHHNMSCRHHTGTCCRLSWCKSRNPMCKQCPRPPGTRSLASLCCSTYCQGQHKRCRSTRPQLDKGKHRLGRFCNRDLPRLCKPARSTRRRRKQTRGPRCSGTSSHPSGRTTL